MEFEKDEGFLFEIIDYAHLNMLLSEIIIVSGIFLFGILQIIGVVDSSIYTGMSRASVMITFGGGGLLFLSIKVYKLIKVEKRRILFYKDKLVRTSNNKTIYLEDVEDILSLSDFLLFFDMVNPKRISNSIFLRSINAIILSLIVVIIVPISLIRTILFSIKYKKLVVTKKIIPLNWNDELSVPIVYPLPNQEEQKKVEEYFKVYLNTDIKTLKTRLI